MALSENSASQFGVTGVDFDKWRSPREGAANPARMDNVVWNWLVKTKISAYKAAEEMQADGGQEAGPTWCFERFGQSSTLLPDGREVFIGGEHEDYYDPDFHIYNDVVVIEPGGSVSIFGYPRDVFPPTDFHTATLVDSKIYVIGCLGYPDSRKPHLERIYVLDTESFVFTSHLTSGDAPPWLYKHRAELSESRNVITVSGGIEDRARAKVEVENLDTWELCLETFTWRRTKHLPWRRWELARADGTKNCLSEIRQALWSRGVRWDEAYQKDMARLVKQLGNAPDIDAVEAVYRPSVPHDYLEEDEENYGTYRIVVNGVTVRFVESYFAVQMTIEGSIPEATAETLLKDVCCNLCQLEGADYAAEEIK